MPHSDRKRRIIMANHQTGTIFRHPVISTFVFAAVLVLVGVFVGRPMLHTAAQDATPSAGPPHAHAVGITLTDLGNGLPVGAPGQVLHLIRVVQEPGAHIDPHRHPGAQVLYVDQGTVGFSVYSGKVSLVRATDEPGAQGELVPEGSEVILEPGDWLYYEQDVVESARNAGDGQAVILLSALYYAGFPLTIFEEGVPPIGTPTP
jgi:quercetin dioxygenase-like cupin family protein